MRETKLGIAAGLFTILAWASAGIFINLLDTLPILLIVSIRLSVSLFALFFIVFFLKKNIRKYLSELNNYRTWLLGFVLFLCYLFGTLAFALAPVGEVTILMTTSPLFVILYKYLRKEKITVFEIIGVILAFLGVLLITFNEITFKDFFASSRLLGNALALFVSLLFALYAIIYKTMNEKNEAPHSFSIAFATFFMGIVLLLFFIDTFMQNNLGTLSNSNVVYLLAISIFSTALPTITYSLASKYLKPIQTTSILLLEPFIAIVLAVIFIKEIPSVFIVPGFVFILLGLFFIIKNKKEKA
ncbi:MAG: hypothetical protein COA66_12845 [Arcobacter sp.]|nr:MAG: hypothetical protein COA66_12845 [Arcobacter sp.]